MNNKFFITCDLEKTLIGGMKGFLNKRQSIDISVRNNLFKIINTSFNENVVEVIHYDSIYNYFNELEKEEDFIISLDDGIYIENADFYFSSTRVYDTKEGIISFPKNYKIMQRNGELLELQNSNIISKIKLSGKKDIILCDDGLFSGDTLKNVINDLQELGITIKEIRIILNFSGKNNLNGIPIKSMYEDMNCIDWLDERDLFYGTKNGGASFRFGNKINGLPYVSSTKMANKKASILPEKSYNFCQSMIDLNKDVWSDFQGTSEKVVKLLDLPRIEYLKEYYGVNDNILDILNGEKNKIL